MIKQRLTWWSWINILKNTDADLDADDNDDDNDDANDNDDDNNDNNDDNDDDNDDDRPVMERIIFLVLFTYFTIITKPIIWTVAVVFIIANIHTGSKVARGLKAYINWK